MVFLKRTFLLIITNILIVITISLLLSLLGVRQWAASSGIDYVSLMTLCGVWGFGGAFISLAISRIMAKLLMGVRVIPPETSDPA